MLLFSATRPSRRSRRTGRAKPGIIRGPARAVSLEADASAVGNPFD